MQKRRGTEAGQAPKTGREDRLKAALKANIARRKAQAAARAGEDGAAKAGVGTKPDDNNRTEQD